MRGLRTLNFSFPMLELSAKELDDLSADMMSDVFFLVV